MSWLSLAAGWPPVGSSSSGMRPTWRPSGGRPPASSPTGRRVGYVGVMGTQDGLDTLLEAWTLVMREPDLADARLELIGDGPARAPLERRIDRSRAGGVDPVPRLPGAGDLRAAPRPLPVRRQSRSADAVQRPVDDGQDHRLHGDRTRLRRVRSPGDAPDRRRCPAPRRLGRCARPGRRHHRAPARPGRGAAVSARSPGAGSTPSSSTGPRPGGPWSTPIDRWRRGTLPRHEPRDPPRRAERPADHPARWLVRSGAMNPPAPPRHGHRRRVCRPRHGGRAGRPRAARAARRDAERPAGALRDGRVPIHEAGLQEAFDGGRRGRVPVGRRRPSRTIPGSS